MTRRDLTPDSWIELKPHWLELSVAEVAFSTLRAELSWEAREIVLFGKRVLQPRLIAWAGNLPYRYSAQTLEPRAFTALTAELLARVSLYTEHAFNHVLINLYRDQRDSMGLHSDSEPELGPDPVVATLTLGAPRTLVLVPRPTSRANVPSSERRLVEQGEEAGQGKQRAHERLLLTPGSLLVMGGACQRQFRHGIPKSKVAVGERISLTFRKVLRSP